MSLPRERERGAESPANMSAELQMFPAGAEMETLRMFVNEWLTAAVDDILGLFGETVARYREQIDRQRGQLDKLRSEEDKWSQTGRCRSRLLYIVDI